MAELESYRRKRNFGRTPEPGPEPVESPPSGPDAAASNLVFVVQQHAARRMHWDFRLEVDGVLKSWPLPKGPSLDPKDKRMAVMVEDHPFDYRTFEGVIPKGEYGGGQVIVWDEGVYTPDEGGVTSWNDKEAASRRMGEAIAAGKISFTLRGEKLRGSFALIKTKYAPDSWLLIKHRDEAAAERDVLAEDRSVRSGLTIADLKEGRLPGAGREPHASAKAAPFPDGRKERPMLATLVEEAFDAPGWLWEPKLDGVRTLAFLKEGEVELRSRRGVDVTKAYPALVEALRAPATGALVLDGEICALDAQGVPRFQLLQPRINLTRAADVAKIEAEIPVVFFVFDLFYADGYDLRAVPLRERKARLTQRLRESDTVRLVRPVEEHGRDLEASARELGLEGVVGKRGDSRYESGVRSRAWLKAKTVRRQELVVGGYTPGEGGRRTSFGALAIGYYDAGGLRYAGNVGSGFDDAELAGVLGRLQKLAQAESPFADEVTTETRWVRPELVVEVKFTEWTQEGRLRAPVFLGLRDDVDPRQVGRETAAKGGAIVETAAASGAAPSDRWSEAERLLAQLENPKASFTVEVAGRPVELTNLDKAFWPAYGETPPLRKRDLVEYYVKVAPALLPHLKDRPLTLTRYPNGIEGALFYQKHYGQPLPAFVETANIWSSSNDADGVYVMCNNLATLVWLAQIADLELHAWMSRLEPEPDATGRPLDASGSEATIDASVLSYPDYLIFDLDPYIYSGQEDAGAEPEYNRRGWEKTVEVALALKELLDQLRLSSFIKTSGKTGLHVYVPILRHYDYDAIRAISQTVGRILVQQRPKDVTLEWDTSKRRGMVFFDANQNTRGKTLAAQYSLRPTAWAGVSTPIAWSELARLDPTSLNLTTLPARLAAKGDLWGEILARKNDLRALIEGGLG